MHIRTNGVRREAACQRGRCHAERETTGAVAHVELDAAFTRLPNKSLDVAFTVYYRFAVSEAVGRHIPRFKVLQQHFIGGSRGESILVHHHECAGGLRRFHSSVERLPAGPRVVRHFDADDQIRSLTDLGRRRFRVHAFEVLLRIADHPISGDVEEGEDSCCRIGNDLLIERVESTPTRSANVKRGGNAGWQAVGVWQHKASEARKVGVQIDQPGHDKKPRYVHDSAGRRCRNLRFNS